MAASDQEAVSDIHNYSIDFHNRELYLHGYITNTDEDPGVEYRMASSTIKNIRILDKTSDKPILIHMHSIGGNWNDGMAIYDVISKCRSHVTILVYGQAESMSSIILQAADHRVMMPHSYFMCHFGSAIYEGSYLDVQNMAKFETTITQSMIDIYTKSAVTGKFFRDAEYSESRVRSYIKNKMKNGDWYMTSEEALLYGFTDQVLSKGIDTLK